MRALRRCFGGALHKGVKDLHSMFERRHSSAITIFPSILYDSALLLRGLSLFLYCSNSILMPPSPGFSYRHTPIPRSLVLPLPRFQAGSRFERERERERVKEERNRELIKVSSRQRTNFNDFLLLMKFSLGVGERLWIHLFV